MTAHRGKHRYVRIYEMQERNMRRSQTELVLRSNNANRRRGIRLFGFASPRRMRSPQSRGESLTDAASDTGNEKGHQVCKGTFDTFRVTLTSFDLIFTRGVANDRHLIERWSFHINVAAREFPLISCS